MTRILTDLPEEDVLALDQLAARNHRSRAAEIREAIEVHLRRRASNDWIERGYGYWQDRDDIGDAVEYQRAIREDRAPAD
jgi:predicted transcriptional regulator